MISVLYFHPWEHVLLRVNFVLVTVGAILSTPRRIAHFISTHSCPLAALSVSIRIGSKIGPIDPASPLGDTASGLLSFPSSGGPGVKHVGLFKNALQVSYDPNTKLLWAINVDD